MLQVLMILVGLLTGAQSGSAFLFTPPTTTIKLAVPFTSEIPDGKWVAPWNNACEEASVVMVDRWYQKELILSKDQAKAAMQPLFDWQNKQYGSNVNSDAKRTTEFIQALTSFTATIVRNPTLQAIKDELRAGRPVISLHYGYDLQNPLHRWRQGGSYYHMMVIVGFDDEKQDFLVNDTALEEGLDYRYSYATIMDSLHDYDFATKKTDLAPTVLFTKKK
jgi:hypothetical protein